MKLVIISTLGAVHLHVVSELARRHPPRLILKPHRPPLPPAPLSDRLAKLRKAPLAALRDRFEQRVRDARMAHTEAEIVRLLFAGAPPTVDATPIAVSELHAPPTLERLRALAPDLLFVSGAPILRPEVFCIPRLGTVNLHYGIAPDYRGEDTLFWPLVRKDYDHLGVTLHSIDRGVDTGRILAHGYPARRGGESETELWAAAARLGAHLIDRFLSTAGPESLSGTPQPAGGRQYFRRERTALWEARYRAARALGCTPPPAPERFVFY